ncbi:hypothetical protein WG66_003220 [Moniliophthora roreri]|nr:hypothetical protein WG66_003220 [Moniliophthora roreri]
MDSTQIGQYGTLALLSFSDKKIITSFGIDTPELSFGRSSNCSVRLYYPDVEDIHAKIVFGDESNKAFLVILGNSGVVIDECKVYPGGGMVPLLNNSELEIHGKIFRFCYPPKEMRLQFVWNTPEQQPQKRRLRLSMIHSAEVFTPRPSSNPAENLRVLQSPLRLAPSSPLRSPLKRSLFSQTATEETEEEIVLVDGSNPHVVEQDSDLVILEELPFAAQPPSPTKKAPPPQLPQLPQHSAPPQTPRRNRPTLHRAVLIRSAQRAVLRKQALEQEKEEEREEMEVFGVLAEDDEEEETPTSTPTEDEVFGTTAGTAEEQDRIDVDQEQGAERSSWLGRIWPFTSRSPSPTKVALPDEDEDEELELEPEPAARLYPSLPQVKDEESEPALTPPTSSNSSTSISEDNIDANKPIEFAIAGTPRRSTSPTKFTSAPKLKKFMTPQPLGLGRPSTGVGRMSMGGLPTRPPKSEGAWKVEDIVIPIPPAPSTSSASSSSSSSGSSASSGRMSLSPRKQQISDAEKAAIKERRKSALTMLSPFAGSAPGMSPAKPKPLELGLGLGSPSRPSNQRKVSSDSKEVGGEEDPRVLLEKMKQAVEGMKQIQNQNRRASSSFSVSPVKSKEQEQTRLDSEEKEGFSLLRSPAKTKTMVPRKSLYVVEKPVPFADAMKEEEVVDMQHNGKERQSSNTAEVPKRSKTPTPGVVETSKPSLSSNEAHAEEEVPPPRRAKTPTPVSALVDEEPLPRAKTPVLIKPPSKTTDAEAAPLRRAKTPTPVREDDEVLAQSKPPLNRAKTPTSMVDEEMNDSPNTITNKSFSQCAKTLIPAPVEEAQEESLVEPPIPPIPEPKEVAPPKTRARSKTPTTRARSKSKTTDPQPSEDEAPAKTTAARRARSRTAEPEPQPAPKTTTRRVRSRATELAQSEDEAPVAEAKTTRTRSRTAEPAPKKPTTRGRANSDPEPEKLRGRAAAAKMTVPPAIKEEPGSPPPAKKIPAATGRTRSAKKVTAVEKDKEKENSDSEVVATGTKTTRSAGRKATVKKEVVEATSTAATTRRTRSKT